MISDSFSFKNPDELKKNVASGKRPLLEYIKFEDQKVYLEKCWAQNPKELFSFDEIYKYLQKHPILFIQRFISKN